MASRLARLLTAISLIVGSIVAVVLGPLANANAAAPPCGTVILAGSSWLGGVGVDVHSNGAQQGTGINCGSESYSNPSVQDGNAWQCVELAARLYYVKGWGTVHAGGNGGATYIPEGSPSLSWHLNGDGYAPVPGDLIIFNATSSNPYGHVAVVDSVSGGTINDVEENASTSGRGVLTISGGSISGNVRGVEHSPNNGNTAVSATSVGVALQANTGNLWTFGNAGTGDHALGMMSGTSPAITWVGNGYQVAFQANTGNLWTTGPLGTGDLGLGMMRGTSPSITTVSGGYEIAFQANTGNLWVAGAQGTGDLGLGMSVGTSPAIASCSGGYGIAFQANTNNLWTAAGAGTSDSGLGMKAGTSPAIACGSNGYGIAFQANTGDLWTAGAAGTSDRGLGMMAGTSPSIASGAGGFGLAFQANTGDLWTAGAAGTSDRGLGMMAGTSPSIAGGASYNVALQANTGDLWTFGAAGTGDCGLGMMRGTSPAIA